MELLISILVAGILLVIGLVIGFKAIFLNQETNEPINYQNKKQGAARINDYKPMFFIFGLAISLGFTYAFLEITKTDLLPWEDLNKLQTFEEVLEEIPITEMPPPPPPKIIQPEFEEVPDDEEIIEQEVIIPEDTIEEIIPVIDVEVFAETEEVAEETIDDRIWNYLDISSQPEFPGGLGMFYKFIKNNYRYPHRDREEGNGGTVYVSFVIEKDGKLTDIRVQRGVNQRLDEEALRVLRLSPKWNPGKVGDQTVRTSFIIPLKLSLGD